VNIILGEFKFEIKEDYCDEKGKFIKIIIKTKKLNYLKLKE